jgi:hypothetical protein
MIDRYGDDGYGDKPADMSRIIYWFQHVPPPARSRSPARRTRRARRAAPEGAAPRGEGE